jgi:hypothetical protein
MQDNTTQKDGDKHSALSGIRTKDVRAQAIKAYVSVRRPLGPGNERSDSHKRR